METSDQKRKPATKGPATDPGAGGAAAGKRDKFQLPPGYESAYLGSGKSFSTDEVDFGQLRESGEIEKEAAGDPDLVKAYGAWLWDEEGLAELVGQKDKPLPKEEKAAALEKLARLTPFDREALDRFFGSLGVAEKFARALGPEGLAQLGKGAPAPAPEEKTDEDDKQSDEKKAAEQPADEKNAAGDDAARQRESKGRFEGGTLFDKLFKTPLEKKKLDDPAPILAQLEALTERGYDELAQMIDRQQAWDPLAQVLGPRFVELVGRLRYEPLRRALVQFPDGVCDPAERTHLLQELTHLGPFEQRTLKALIEQRGTGNALANLLGPELQLWLSGGALVPDKREPEEEPEAALAAARELSPPTQRRLAELLTAAAVGPALLEGLGAESEPFVRGYWEAVTRPDPEQKESSKLPLRALARVDAAQLRLLAWCGERKGQEPASLDAGAGTTQFDALLRPLLQGAAPSPEAKKKTLEALRSLSLAELRDLLRQLSADGTAALEALLGAGFGELVGERFYGPLEDALQAYPGDDELPEAEKEKHLSRLHDLDAYSQARLKAQVAQKTSGPRLAGAFGKALKRIGLDELAEPGVRPPPTPRWQPTGPQRKKALAALKKLSPAAFAALSRGTRESALVRFATGAAAGWDEEVGRALLQHLPAELPDEPVDPAADNAGVRAFFDRLAAPAPDDGMAARPKDAPAPKKRKREDDDEQQLEETEEAEKDTTMETGVEKDAGQEGEKGDQE